MIIAAHNRQDILTDRSPPLYFSGFIYIIAD